MILVFIGVFALLYASFPSDFFLYQDEYSLAYQTQVEITEEFKALDLTVYSSASNDTMIYDYSSIFDAPDPPQWETAVSGRFCEIWWSLWGIQDVGTIGPGIQILDTEEREFLGYKYYVAIEECRLTVNDADYIGICLLDQQIKNDYGDDYNITISAVGSYISANMILKANGTDTLEESIDNGILLYSLTWEIDFEAMKPSVWLLIGQLLTFQSPDFGIPGLFGEIITYILALVIWASIILITYTLITKLIPTIQGGLED